MTLNHNRLDHFLLFLNKSACVSGQSDKGYSSLELSSVAVQLSLCWTWSETQKTCFLMTGLIYEIYISVEQILEGAKWLIIFSFFCKFILFGVYIAICDLVHDAETISINDAS